jgi:hypothetical protein
MLTLDSDDAPDSLIACADGDSLEERTTHLMFLLADAVACAFSYEPIRFISEGRQVGRVEIIETPFGSSSVRVRGHLSLTYLSWLLWEGRAGFFLALPPVMGEVPGTTGRKLQRRSARRPTNG